MRGIGDAVVAFAILGLFATPYFVSFGRPLLQYLMPDAFILLVVGWRFRGETLRRLGLAIPLRDLVAAIGFFAVGFVLVEGLMRSITETGGLIIFEKRPVYSLTQVLHQELVVHGLFLGTLASKFPSRVRLAVAVALVFALIHPLLYWWKLDLMLPATTMLTLFSFGLATSLLFLRAGHIAFAFAAHAGWNLHRFGTFYARSGVSISEAQSFAEIEGSTIALVASVALLVVVLLFEAVPSLRARKFLSGEATFSVGRTSPKK